MSFTSALPEQIVDEVELFASFHFQESSDSKSGMHLEPIEGLDTFAYLRPMLEAPLGVVEMWKLLSDRASNPLVVSRALDLLFSSRLIKTATESQRLVETYIEASRDGLISTLFRAQLLHRAMTITRIRKLPAMEWVVLDRLLECASEEVDLHNGNAGSTCHLIECLGRMKPYSSSGFGHQEVQAVIVDALSLYRDNIFAFASLTAVAVQLAETPDQRDAFNSAMFHRLLEDAEKDAGFGRMEHLRQAAESAQRSGLNELAGQATLLMELEDSSTYEWRTSSVTRQIQSSQLAPELGEYSRHGNWGDAIRFWTRSPEIFQSSSHSSSTTGLLRLANTFIYASHGLPELQVSSDEDHSRRSSVEADSLSVDWYSIASAIELSEIAAIHRIPGVDELRKFLAGPLAVSADWASPIAEAMSLFWSDQYSLSVMRAFPLVEVGVRSRLVALGQPTFAVAVGGAKSAHATLGSLVTKLDKTGVDSNLVRELRIFETLRNDAAHGFRFDFTKDEAAFVARLSIRLLRQANAIKRPDSP